MAHNLTGSYTDQTHNPACGRGGRKENEIGKWEVKKSEDGGRQGIHRRPTDAYPFSLLQTSSRHTDEGWGRGEREQSQQTQTQHFIGAVEVFGRISTIQAQS